MRTKDRIDILLVTVHLVYIVSMFLIVGFLPFYISFLFMLAQWIHDQVLGDCILTIAQRNYGYAEENEDFFHYLFRKMHIQANRKLTRSFHHIIRLFIFILFLYQLGNYFNYF